MDEDKDTFRLAIGVFYEPQRLASAIDELTADGVTGADLCLVGTRQAIDAVAPPAAFSATGEARAASVAVVRGLGPQLGELELFATDGRLLERLLEHTKASEDGDGTSQSWLLPDLFGSLVGHLRAGAVALIISAPSFGSQRRGSRILLRNTAHTVQTHEFAPRQAGRP